MDYQGNAKKDKLEAAKPVKAIKPVISGEVIVKKKSLGRKFRDLFIEADLRSVLRYIGTDVLLPAFRNMVVDGASKGVERMMYGETAARRRSIYGGSRTTYNIPINRGIQGSPLRSAPPQRLGAGTSRSTREDFILSTREEAELVLERMNDIIDAYEVVSVQDLNDLVGYPSQYTDNKWGWAYLGNVPIRQIREGYLIDFPPAEALQ